MSGLLEAVGLGSKKDTRHIEQRLLEEQEAAETETGEVEVAPAEKEAAEEASAAETEASADDAEEAGEESAPLDEEALFQHIAGAVDELDSARSTPAAAPVVEAPAPEPGPKEKTLTAQQLMASPQMGAAIQSAIESGDQAQIAGLIATAAQRISEEQVSALEQRVMEKFTTQEQQTQTAKAQEAMNKAVVEVASDGVLEREIVTQLMKNPQSTQTLFARYVTSLDEMDRAAIGTPLGFKGAVRDLAQVIRSAEPQVRQALMASQTGDEVASPETDSVDSGSEEEVQTQPVRTSGKSRASRAGTKMVTPPEEGETVEEFNKRMIRDTGNRTGGLDKRLGFLQ